MGDVGVWGAEGARGLSADRGGKGNIRRRRSWLCTSIDCDNLDGTLIKATISVSNPRFRPRPTAEDRNCTSYYQLLRGTFVSMAGRFVRASKYRKLPDLPPPPPFPAPRPAPGCAAADRLLARARLWQAHPEGVLLRQPPHQPQCLGHQSCEGEELSWSSEPAPTANGGRRRKLLTD